MVSSKALHNCTNTSDCFYGRSAAIPMIGALLSLIWFVTDCDNTLVHYESVDASHSDGSLSSNFPHKNGNDFPFVEAIINLPASSGSGKVASLSSGTVGKLDEISKEGVQIICATGMRASTMLQREVFFPSISYWACENGGRIFYRENYGEPPKEITEYTELFKSNIELKNDLAAFAETLRNEGLQVDSNGYHTMIRVKGDDLGTVVSRIPHTLSHTFNLGYLDIQYPGCGKLAAARWIIRNHHLQVQRVKADSQNPSNGLLASTPNTLGPHPTENLTDDLPFFFMGDDDNDVEIASASREAFITKPCSDAMQRFIDTFHLSRSGGNSESFAVHKVHEAPFLRHRGTETLLENVLQTVRAKRELIMQSDEL